MSRSKYGVFLLIIILFALGSGIYINKTHYSHEEVEDHTEISLWYVESSDFSGEFAKIADKYNKLEDNSKNNITVKTKSFESYDALDSALNKASIKALPDMVACNVDEAALFREKGYTLNPSRYFDDWNLDGLNEDLIKCATVKNKIIAIPYAADVELMLINTDCVADVDCVESFEGLCATAKDYYSAYGSPMFSITDYADFFRMAMAQFGEDFDGVSPRDTNNENCKHIYKLLAQNAFDRGLSSSQNTINDLVSGKIPCTIASSSFIMKSAPEIGKNIKVCVCPSMENGKQVYELDTECICICKTDENRQNASAEFLKWFISPEINEEFVSDSGYIPMSVKMKALKSSLAEFDGVKKAIATLESKGTHVNFAPNVDYFKNRDEFIYVMKLVMDSLS